MFKRRILLTRETISNDGTNSHMLTLEDELERAYTEIERQAALIQELERQVKAEQVTQLEQRKSYQELVERQAALIERAKNVIEDLVEFGYNSGPYGYKQWLKDAEEE